MQAKSGTLTAPTVQSARSSTTAPWLAGPPRRAGSPARAAQHHVHQIVFGHGRSAVGADMAAIAQNGDAVGQRLDSDRKWLISTTPTPCVGRRRMMPKAVPFRARGQGRGRLVQDDDAGGATQGAHDLDHLAVGHRQFRPPA